MIRLKSRDSINSKIKHLRDSLMRPRRADDPADIDAILRDNINYLIEAALTFEQDCLSFMNWLLARLPNAMNGLTMPPNEKRHI